jgi:hypothetical protein
MKEKNSYLALTYLVLGCLGIIGTLAIYVPSIQRYSRNIDALSSGIKVNLTNHDYQLAEFNIKLLESNKDSLMSSITRATTYVAIITGWIFIRIAIMYIPEKKIQGDISSKTIEVK